MLITRQFLNSTYLPYFDIYMTIDNEQRNEKHLYIDGYKTNPNNILYVQLFHESLWESEVNLFIALLIMIRDSEVNWLSVILIAAKSSVMNILSEL